MTENSDRYGLVRECLADVDYLIVNESEAANMAGASDDTVLHSVAQSILDLGVRERVVIHHPAGAVSLAKSGKWTERPSIDVPQGFINGKTGAGDAFCAGALVGIFKNLSDEEILDLGSLAAVGALSAPGATEGMRTIADLKKLISTFNT